MTTKAWPSVSKISSRMGLPVTTTWRMRLLGRKVSISLPEHLGRVHAQVGGVAVADHDHPHVLVHHQAAFGQLVEAFEHTGLVAFCLRSGKSWAAATNE